MAIVGVAELSVQQSRSTQLSSERPGELNTIIVAARPMLLTPEERHHVRLSQPAGDDDKQPARPDAQLIGRASYDNRKRADLRRDWASRCRAG